MKKLFAIMSAVVLAFALAGCGGGTLSVDTDDKGVHAVSEGSPQGEGTGQITIPEDKGICVNHIVNKGKFHVKITDKSGNVVFDKDLTDNIADMIDANGEFDVVISADTADGTVDIIAYDKEAQANADATLDDAMKQATGKTAEEMGIKKSENK